MPRTARRRAWGSIKPVMPNKKYILRWVESTPQGRIRRCETFYGTYREADRRLAELRLAHECGKRAPTVREAYESWLLPMLKADVASGKIAESTFKANEAAWRLHACPRWGDVPLDAVRPLDVQEWLDGMTRQIASKSMYLLRSLGELAVKYEAAEANKFAVEYRMPTAEKKAKSTDTLSLPQAEAMLERLRGLSMEPAFIMACFGSCRASEAIAVKARDVRARERGGLAYACVEVDKQMEGGKAETTERMKTRDSGRTVIVPPPYSARLLEIARERERDGIEWLSHRGDGTPFTRSQANHAWKRDAAGAPPIANLRPSWRTFAQFEWGIDYDTLELLMGHKLKGVTGAHYLRPSFDQLFETFSGEFQGYYEGLRENKGKILQNPRS